MSKLKSQNLRGACIAAICCTFLWWILPLPGSAQTGKNPQSSADVGEQTAPTGTEALLAAIEEKRKKLAEQVGAIQRQMSESTGQRAAAQVTLLKKHLDVLQQLDAVFVQQSSELQKGLSLATERQQYQDELKKLHEAPGKTITFADLDRAREELDGQAARQSALEAKLKQVREQQAQAKDAFDEQQAAFAELENEARKNTKDPLATERLELARSQRELAQQTLQLLEIQADNANQALAAYTAEKNLLEQRVAYMVRHAVFDKAELQSQLQDVENEEFQVKRQLSQANEQQLSTSARLAEAQRRLVKSTATQQQRLGDEVDAKRLGDEQAKVMVDLLSRRLQLLSAWKSVWKRRYAVFNGLQNPSDWLKWKNEAFDNIDAIEQQERLIQLWLNDWQKQLITRRNELADLGGRSSARQWIEQQRVSVEKIIAAYQEQNTFLENSRRLQQNLIELINNRTAHRTWREWLRLVLDYQLYGNRLGHWASAAGSAAGLFTLLVVIRNFLIARLQVHAEADDARAAAQFFASVRRTTTFFLLMISIFLSAFWLSLSPQLAAALKHITMVALIFQGAIWLNYFFGSWIRSYLGARAKRDAASKGALSIFNFVSQATVWSIALLLILQNVGIDVTALATGLGIGGVAVALALQRILGDLFSSLSIVMDKPFISGDFIIFDQVLGTVEHIGIKTTRIRSLDGEQVICANSDLLNTRIRNFQRMHERRVVFQIGVVYQTPARQLAQIPQMLAEIVAAQEHARCDRAHSKSYGDFALIYEIVYYVNSPDYNLYMDIQQAINLAIFESFQAKGIEFAYPTQSLYLQGGFLGGENARQAEQVDQRRGGVPA